MLSILMALAAVCQSGQKTDSSRNAQHQQRAIFDFVCQFSECIPAKALGFVTDRLGYAGRAFSYAARNAIKCVADELTDIIRGAGRFALGRSRQATKPFLKVTSSAAAVLARVVILHLKTVDFAV
jgi:hypothetical protein